jgi:hypothetical protein
MSLDEMVGSAFCAAQRIGCISSGTQSNRCCFPSSTHPLPQSELFLRKFVHHEDVERDAVLKLREEFRRFDRVCCVLWGRSLPRLSSYVIPLCSLTPGQVRGAGRRLCNDAS